MAWQPGLPPQPQAGAAAGHGGHLTAADHLAQQLEYTFLDLPDLVDLEEGVLWLGGVRVCRTEYGPPYHASNLAQGGGRHAGRRVGGTGATLRSCAWFTFAPLLGVYVHGVPRLVGCPRPSYLLLSGFAASDCAEEADRGMGGPMAKPPATAGGHHAWAPSAQCPPSAAASSEPSAAAPCAHSGHGGHPTSLTAQHHHHYHLGGAPSGVGWGGPHKPLPGAAAQAAATHGTCAPGAGGAAAAALDLPPPPMQAHPFAAGGADDMMTT